MASHEFCHWEDEATTLGLEDKDMVGHECCRWEDEATTLGWEYEDDGQPRPAATL